MLQEMAKEKIVSVMIYISTITKTCDPLWSHSQLPQTKNYKL